MNYINIIIHAVLWLFGFFILWRIPKCNGSNTESENSKSIGRVRAFNGNFAIALRAYTYMLRLGKEGTRRVSKYSVLNANYIKARLTPYLNLRYKKHCMHEVVFNDEKQQEYHVSTMDIAKRLMDFNYHPPTIYFPLIVHGALMIEPTETESKDTLDKFIDVVIKITEECKVNPKVLRDSPHRAIIKRVDAVKAARNPIIVCNTSCN